MSLTISAPRRRSALAATIGAVALVAGLFPATAALAAPATEASTISADASERTVPLAGDASIELPGERTAAEIDTARVPDDLRGATAGALLSTEDRGSTISSYPTNAGVQTLIEIPTALAPREYRFPLDLPAGGQAAVLPDGSVLLIDADGAAIGGFRAPWAVAADGADVPTSFRIEGGELVQTVEFTVDTAFPVIADPDFGVEWWGVYMQFTRAETQGIAGASGDTQSMVGLISGACTRIPHAAGAAACAVVANAIALQYAVMFRNASGAGRCVAVNFPWTTISQPQIAPPNATVVDCRS